MAKISFEPIYISGGGPTNEEWLRHIGVLRVSMNVLKFEPRQLAAKVGADDETLMAFVGIVDCIIANLPILKGAIEVLEAAQARILSAMARDVEAAP